MGRLAWTILAVFALAVLGRWWAEREPVGHEYEGRIGAIDADEPE